MLRVRRCVSERVDLLGGFSCSKKHIEHLGANTIVCSIIGKSVFQGRGFILDAAGHDNHKSPLYDTQCPVKQDMEDDVRGYLRSTQRNPEIVKSCFRAKNVCYAND